MRRRRGLPGLRSSDRGSPPVTTASAQAAAARRSVVVTRSGRTVRGTGCARLAGVGSTLVVWKLEHEECSRHRGRAVGATGLSLVRSFPRTVRLTVLAAARWPRMTGLRGVVRISGRKRVSSVWLDMLLTRRGSGGKSWISIYAPIFVSRLMTMTGCTNLSGACAVSVESQAVGLPGSTVAKDALQLTTIDVAALVTNLAESVFAAFFAVRATLSSVFTSCLRLSAFPGGSAVSKLRRWC